MACSSFLKEAKSIGKFTFEAAPEGATPPPPEATCTISIPVHLRYEYPLGTNSIGHMIRDNMHWLFALAQRYGLPPRGVAWAQWPRGGGNHWQEVTHSMEKYWPLVSSHRVYKWHELEQQCEEGVVGKGALRSTLRFHAVREVFCSCESCKLLQARRKQRDGKLHSHERTVACARCRPHWYHSLQACKSRQEIVAATAAGFMPGAEAPARTHMRISVALVSSQGAYWTLHGDKTRPCVRSAFRDMRDAAYEKFGVPHVPAARRGTLRIGFIVKKARDRRRMLVPRGVVDAIRARYPEATIEWHVGQDEPLDTQIAWLARTDILVGNIGSPSFRLVYLPDGAQAIVAGGLEGPINGTDGAPHRLPHSFRETEECWRDLGYVRMHAYHVTDSADIQLPPLRPEHVRNATPKRDWEVVRAWVSAARVCRGALREAKIAGLSNRLQRC